MQKLILSCLSLAILGSTALVQAEEKGEKGPRRPDTKQGERPNREEFRKQLLEKFDTNKDGKLDEKERAAAKAEMQKRRGQGAGKGGPERQKRRAEFMKKFDKDGDGKLNETERAAAKKAMEELRKKNGNRGPRKKPADKKPADKN